MFGSKAFYLLIPLTLFTLSCRSSNRASVQEASPSGAGLALDVNDVSILFPLPGDEKDIPKMVPINFQNADGVSPMTPELFKEIISRHLSKIDVEGQLKPLASGADFTGNNRNGRIGESFGPFGEIGDWKIVAMRYDSCAPVQNHNVLGHAPRPMPSTIDPEACTPQLRLTAQPVMARRRESVSRFGTEGNGDSSAIASDYAIHMLFTLKDNEPLALYKDLQKFKQDCGDLTSSVPLGIHPCLKAEVNSGSYGGPNFSKVSTLLKLYAKRYSATAMMATKSGDDPWVFMNGQIEGGRFKHAQIAAVTEDDPTKLKRNKAGNLLEPFLNGYFQQLQFTELRDEPTASNFDNGDRVSPQPRLSKVNDSLRAEFNTLLFSHQNDEKFNSNAAEVSRIFNRIDNPLYNDFFSTDCVSCHASTNLYTIYTTQGPFNRPATDESKRSPIFGYTSPDYLLKDKHPKYIRIKGKEFFDLEDGYTNLVEHHTLTRGSRSTRAAGLIHFGYLEDKPNVSFRAANESAQVAKLSNMVYGQGISPKVSCPKDELRACLNYDENASNLAFLGVDFILSSCMMAVCPTRALELKSVFGPNRAQNYKAKHDILLDDYTNGDVTVSIPAGAVIKGFMRIESDSISFHYHQPIELISNKGDKLYVEPSKIWLLYKTSWQEDFEIVE